MELYVIRHGETDWNVQQRLQGREDVPLNETGRAQAAECGRALSALIFSMIYTSPLSRARETAETIARWQDCGVTVDPGLIERDYGRLSGLTLPERERWARSGQPDGMEPWPELKDRVLEAVERLSGQAGPVALVTHGAWLNTLLAALSDRQIGTGKTRLKNACVNVFRREPDGWAIVTYNLTPAEYTDWMRIPSE